MGFRDLLSSRSSSRLPVAPLTLWIEERDWDTEGDQGDHLDGHGFGLRDEGDRAVAWDDPILAGAGIVVLKIAGTSHRLVDIQGERFAPGSPLSLRPDPTNQYDRNAVGVWDASGKVQAGFVPAEYAEALAKRIARERLEAFCLWEWRDESGQRCGLRMLIHPPAVAVRQQPRRRP